MQSHFGIPKTFYVACVIGIALTMSSAVAQSTFPKHSGSPNPYSGFVQLPECKAYAGTVKGRDAREQNFCAGELRALAYISWVLPPDINSCVPDGIPNGQLALVVIAYIEARPAQMQEDFLALALKAYRDAWPCWH